MASNDMSGALKHSHPDVPFAKFGDDTITALSQLVAIFKNKFQKPLAPELVQAPVKAAENKQPAGVVQPILTQPMKKNYHTRSQHASPRQPSNLIHSRNSPLLPRVVTPVARHGASPRVSARTHNLFPRIFSQDDFWDMENSNQAISLGTNHWTNIHMANGVVHPITGKEMEYTALMKDPVLQPLWKIGIGNEVGRLVQGIRDIQGTNTCFLIELKNIPKDRQITYGKIVCEYKPHKKEKERVRLTVGGERLDYSVEVATFTADITTFQILINSTLSKKDAEMMMMDKKNYYLGTPLPRYKYMRMLLSRIPE
jgi:hypothetical protein